MDAKSEKYLKNAERFLGTPYDNCVKQETEKEEQKQDKEDKTKVDDKESTKSEEDKK